MTAPSNLTFFTVQGHWYDVEDPILSGSTNTPQFEDVSAFVTFTARLKPGTALYIASANLPDSSTNSTAVMLPPRQGRILDGELQTINRGNTLNVQLVANTPTLHADGLSLTTLIYDVAFTSVSYAGAAGALTNFAFQAPTTATIIDITAPTFDRLPYDPTNYPTS